MTPEELFNNNQKLVGYVYKKYIGNYKLSDIDDIMQEGRLALWKASNIFDESKGIKFSTFATKYIWGYMIRYLRDATNVVRIPRKVYDDNDPDTINRLKYITSLDKEISDDNESSLSDIIPGPDDSYEYITDNLIDSFLKTIKNKTHRDIMEEYYYACAYDVKLNQLHFVEKYKYSQSYISRLIEQYNLQFQKFLNT